MATETLNQEKTADIEERNIFHPHFKRVMGYVKELILPLEPPLTKEQKSELSGKVLKSFYLLISSEEGLVNNLKEFELEELTELTGLSTVEIAQELERLELTDIHDRLAPQREHTAKLIAAYKKAPKWTWPKARKAPKATQKQKNRSSGAENPKSDEQDVMFECEIITLD